MQISDAFVSFHSAMLGEVAESTRRWYLAMLSPLVEDYGHVPVVELSAAHLRTWRAELIARLKKDEEDEDGISIHTIHGHLRAAKSFCNWLVSEGLIESSPAARLKLPKLPDEKPKAISANDLQKLLLHASQVNKRDYAIICFLADTGCRVSGLCGLLLKNLYLDDGTAIVKEKGQKLRPVYFGRVTYVALCAYLAERPKHSSGCVFLGRKGPLKPAGVREMLKRRGEGAGCTGRVNPHSFRHAFAREYLRNGGDLTTLGRLMGHAPGSPVTGKSYAVWAKDELQWFHGRYSPLRTDVDAVSTQIRAKLD